MSVKISTGEVFNTHEEAVAFMAARTEGDRVLLVHGEDVYDPFKPGAEWRIAWHRLTPEEAANRRLAIEEGTLRLPDWEEMPPNTAKRVKARLLRTYEDAPQPGVVPYDEGRWLVPDVWRWGHKPLLSGQPRAGKSTLVADLIASLLVPDRRFLDHYEPSELTDDERDRGIWLINAENPEPELRDVIEATGLEHFAGDTIDGGRYYPEGDGPGWLMVDHLEALGGASMFDLREPANYDWWANRIVDLSCAQCDGRDESPPLVVIVDGLTAILGSKTDAYGEWYAQFRRLMNELEIPSALAVVHSPMTGGEAMNGVESIAQADGTWKYTMGNVHDHRSSRRFEGSRRLVRGGIEGGLVVLGSDGRLRIPRGEAAATSAAPASDALADRKAEIRAKLREAGRVGMLTTDITGRGDEGIENKKALTAMGGEVVSKPEQRGRVRGIRWWLSEFANDD